MAAATCMVAASGLTAFADEVLAAAQGTFDFKDGYEYTKTFSDYVMYEDFGAVGDGKADDFDAIVKTSAATRTQEPIWDFVKISTLGREIGDNGKKE